MDKNGKKPPEFAGKMPPRMRKPDKKTIIRLLSYMGQYKLKLFLVIACIVISAIASVASSLFTQSLIDDYIAPLLLQGTPDYGPLILALVKLAALYIAGILSQLFYSRIMCTVTQGVLKTIRDEMFTHMQTLPIKYFDAHSFGETMSHYTNDADTLRQMISMGVPQFVSSTITIVTVFFSMLSISIWLTLAVLVVVFFVFRMTGGVMKKSRTYFVRQQQSVADVNGYIEEMMNGQRVVKVFNYEDKAMEIFEEKNDELRHNMTVANGNSIIMMPLTNCAGYILYILMAVVGGAMGIAGVHNLSLSGANILTLGMIASFLQLSRSFLMPITQISNQLNSIIMALAGAERIFAMLDEKPETDEGYVTLVNAKYVDGVLTETEEKTRLWAWKHPHHDGTTTYTELKGDIRMFEVDFEYVKGKPVLHDISLYAKPGQKVAFVGATGAGKTTITNLINRFYDIADGKIRYDGININKIKKADLRRSLGIVLQDVNLFTGTVMENIRYGKLDATDEECIKAAKLANADGFIRMLPQGYQTVISGDGEGLSQGQRQLISIARAAVADPPVMILDEATSSIDTRTEAIVQKGMDQLMEGRTVFVIAHRLSTVQNSNVIMVLDHGRIIERGTHEELIELGGTYSQLYSGVFELE
ncbi:MAG: ABC transporter ATP-binding protein [Christensenellaceae bacterium]|nr:ABC transporter ATP-binding protein [Christensenellaceae bacterium]